MNKDFIAQEMKKIKRNAIMYLGVGWLIALGLAAFTYFTIENYRYTVNGIPINNWVTVSIGIGIMAIWTLVLLVNLIRGQKSFFKVYPKEASPETARGIINGEVSRIQAEIQLTPVTKGPRMVIMPTYTLFISGKIHAILTQDILWIRLHPKSSLVYEIYTRNELIKVDVQMDENSALDPLTTIMPQIETHFPNIFAHLTAAEQADLAQQFDKDRQGFMEAYHQAKTIKTEQE